MTLRNIIMIADEKLTMALYSKINGNSYRYNFKNQAWDGDAIIDPDKLITVGEFKRSDVYRNHKKDRLDGWSVLDPKNLARLKNYNNTIIKCERGLILSLNIEIDQSSTTSPKGRRAQANGVRHYGPK